MKPKVMDSNPRVRTALMNLHAAAWGAGNTRTPLWRLYETVVYDLESDSMVFPDGTTYPVKDYDY